VHTNIFLWLGPAVLGNITGLLLVTLSKYGQINLE
jgi:hypothetical protein